MNIGIVYVATGKKYIEEASISAFSAKQWMPDLPITVFTDQQDVPDCFDNVVPITSTGDGFKDKVVFMAQSPYERTLFLDTDTYLCNSVYELFELLDHFDIAMAHDHLVRQICDIKEVPTSFPEFNSGVIAFKKAQNILDTFNKWAEIYDEEKNVQTIIRYHDQPSLRKSIYLSDLRIATLTPEYNCMLRYAGSVSGEVKILHCARIGYGWYKRENIEHAAKLMNSVQKARVFVDGRLFAFLRTPTTSFSKFNPFWSVYTNKFIGWLFPPDWARRAQRIPDFVRRRGVYGVIAMLFRWSR